MKFGRFKPREIFSALLSKTFPHVSSDRNIYSLLPANRKHLWIIAAPKTGSTWLSAILENDLGGETRSLTGAFDRREQEPCLRSLAQTATYNNVLWRHQHTRASQPTIDFDPSGINLPYHSDEGHSRFGRQFLRPFSSGDDCLSDGLHG